MLHATYDVPLPIATAVESHPSWTDFRGKPGTNTPNQDAYTQAISLRPGPN